mmetsp:Transcript_36768/g.96709  ORF Transcript_36768/g.96709 Transcript_36768/m.96709 type:complete len:361 (-) Transcript_36768:16-1098(-)
MAERKSTRSSYLPGCLGATILSVERASSCITSKTSTSTVPTIEPLLPPSVSDSRETKHEYVSITGLSVPSRVGTFFWYLARLAPACARSTATPTSIIVPGEIFGWPIHDLAVKRSDTSGYGAPCPSSCARAMSTHFGSSSDQSPERRQTWSASVASAGCSHLPLMLASYREGRMKRAPSAAATCSSATTASSRASFCSSASNDECSWYASSSRTAPSPPSGTAMSAPITPFFSSSAWSLRSLRGTAYTALLPSVTIAGALAMSRSSVSFVTCLPVAACSAMRSRTYSMSLCVGPVASGFAALAASFALRYMRNEKAVQSTAAVRTTEMTVAMTVPASSGSSTAVSFGTDAIGRGRDRVQL